MKQYVIDELRYKDFERIKSYFDEHFVSSDVGGLYWVYLEPDILSKTQAAHEDCKPYYFAIELAEDRLSCELLVRTGCRIRCDCIHYATRSQRDWLIQLIDTILEKLEIQV